MLFIHTFEMVVILAGAMLFQLQNNQGNSNSLEEKLNSYKWQKRVILVITPSADSKEFMEQKKELETKIAGIQDRELENIYLATNSLNDTGKTFIRKKFEIQDQNFCIILIGKDGSEKRRSNASLQAEDLFQTIDAMPMRRQEMKDKN